MRFTAVGIVNNSFRRLKNRIMQTFPVFNICHFYGNAVEYFRAVA